MDELEPKAKVRDELIWKMVEMMRRHRKELQHECFTKELKPESCVMKITGEMFCDIDDMLGTVDKYRLREEW